MRKKELSNKKRITELKKLLSDGKILGFSCPLLLGYQEQLATLQEEVSQDKEKARFLL